MVLRSPLDRDPLLDAVPPRRAVQGSRRLVCRLTTLHPERALALALVQHLAQELPDIEFTLEARAAPDVVWVCGYERGHAPAIDLLRQRYPLARLFVTGKEAPELWADEVRAAGADSALAWPLDLGSLNRALHRARLQRRA